MRSAGGSEVDGDAAQRPFELGRGDPTADPLLRLLAGAIGEPDDREGRHPRLEVRLDLDAARLEADEGVGERTCEHAATLRRRGVRDCVDFVPKAALRALSKPSA